MSFLRETGYKGQDYRIEIKWRDPSSHEGEEDWVTYGWIDKEDGGSLRLAAEMWPAVKEVRVVRITNKEEEY